ncbi:MAG: ribonuclease III [Clostridia bacterium]|nr:ribonuclease III [Clostridia bacterium]
MAIFDVNGCEQKLGYVFKDKMLLRQCFTHASYGFEHGENNNELLEFFGDSVLQLVVTEYLFKNSKGDEGKLTKERALMVARDPLTEIVKKLDISQYVLLGRGQDKSENLDQKLYSSVYEAVVAGIYIDGGMTAVKKFIKTTLIKNYEDSLKKTSRPVKTVSTQSKNQLQEYVQKNKIGSISYQTLGVSGPSHKPQFRVSAMLNGISIAEGTGGSKKLAEASAAEKALKKLILGRKK